MRLRYWYLTLFFTFLLGSQDGFIALWKIPGADPAYVFPYSVSSLPPADRQKLEKGIKVETTQELMTLLEDYLS